MVRAGSKPYREKEAKALLGATNGPENRPKSFDEWACLAVVTANSLGVSRLIVARDPLRRCDDMQAGSPVRLTVGGPLFVAPDVGKALIAGVRADWMDGGLVSEAKIGYELWSGWMPLGRTSMLSALGRLLSSEKYSFLRGDYWELPDALAKRIMDMRAGHVPWDEDLVCAQDFVETMASLK